MLSFRDRDFTCFTMHRLRFLLLTLLLAFGQFAQALHQVEHVSDYNPAQCQICLQALDACPNTPSALINPLFVLLPALPPVAPLASKRSPASHNWRARAPPALR